MKRKENSQKGELQLSVYTACEPEELVLPPHAEEVVTSAIKAALEAEGFFESTEISLTFCDGPYIRALNATYRQKDAETDVLSFPMFDEDEEDALDEEIIPLGDIVLNVDRAAEQARELSHSHLREMAFLAVHSTLHLLGYDHERGEAEDEDMCARQKRIMAALAEKEEF